MQAASHASQGNQSSSKREAGPAQFVIRKVFPLTGMTSVARFNSTDPDAGQPSGVGRGLLESGDTFKHATPMAK